MRRKVKQLMGILLSLVTVLGLMLGISWTANAATETYTKLMNDKTVVKFNGYNWYIIADDSTATGGTITLLAADTSFGTSKFHDISNAYSSSTVKSKLDALTAEGGAFASVKDAIADTNLSDVGVTGAKLYLLSTNEANPYAGLYFTGADFGCWWLRSPGITDNHAAIVFAVEQYVHLPGDYVTKEFGVRPALRLDLSKVIFSSESKTFILQQEITADEVTVTYGDTDKCVSAIAIDPVSGGGTISYAPSEGSKSFIDVDSTTGALTVKMVPPNGKATVIVTAAETDTYAQATEYVVINVVRKKLTITAKDQTYVYNGKIQGDGGMAYGVGEFEEKVIVEGLVGDDVLVTVVLDGQATEIGVYKDCITPSIVKIAKPADDFDLDYSTCYDISFVGGTLTIMSHYSREWVKGKWYNKDGSQTYEPLASWEKDGSDWMYVDDSGWRAENRWQKIDGVWYFFDREGHMTRDAYQKDASGKIWYLTKNGSWDEKEEVAGWTQDDKGWKFVLYGDDYLKNTWKMINGNWYYFKADGYAAQNEFVKGYWLNKAGAWKDPVKYSWHKSGSKWWYGVEDGWYAKNGTYIIDGKEYTFDKKGYLK